MRQWDVGTTRNITPGGINGSEGIVSKNLMRCIAGPSKNWIKVKNPKAPVAMRIIIMVSQP